MKTSDWMIVKCMEIIHHGFVGLRGIGSFTYPSFSPKEGINKTVLMCRVILDCLNQDVGDEQCSKMIIQSKMFPKEWVDKIRGRAIPTEPLVNDAMKKDIFNFIAAAIQDVEDSCLGDKINESYSLYWEMDKVHNMPMEIYKAQKNIRTKYGNFINK